MNDRFSNIRRLLDTDIRRLVSGGVSVDHIDKNGWAPIHHAASYSRDSTLRLLVEELGAQVNIVNGEAQTALHILASVPTKFARNDNDTMIRNKSAIEMAAPSVDDI